MSFCIALAKKRLQVLLYQTFTVSLESYELWRNLNFNEFVYNNRENLFDMKTNFLLNLLAIKLGILQIKNI